jgi:UDP:flavonoid glycosyltransferase YjiC (YdhE family)
MDAGHEVMLLAADGTLASAQHLGVPHAALAGDIRGLLQPGEGIATVIEKTSMNASAKALAKIANDNAAAWMRQALEVAAGCDVLIGAGLAACAGFCAAEKLGIPILGAGMFPLTPTAEFPSPFLPPRRMPGWLNQLSHHLVVYVLWRELRKAINSARVTVCGLPPRKKPWIGHPMLYGVSPSLLPRPADWPSNAYMCGQWVRPVRDWNPPQSLRDFLAAGEPPVYVGFGSMVGFDRDTLLNAVVTAVGGRRALFYPGWTGAQGLKLPGNFCVIADTPHDWLFPKVSLVIHHGGSGTTHSATRAGVPSIVLPFAGDQPFWAERLRVLGVAPETPGGRHVPAQLLERAIDAAGASPMRSRAATLGARMRAEDGPASTVATLESLLPVRMNNAAPHWDTPPNGR